jgi:hypothetical protein
MEEDVRGRRGKRVFNRLWLINQSAHAEMSKGHTLSRKLCPCFEAEQDFEPRIFGYLAPEFQNLQREGKKCEKGTRLSREDNMLQPI